MRFSVLTLLLLVCISCNPWQRTENKSFSQKGFKNYAIVANLKDSVFVPQTQDHKDSSGYDIIRRYYSNGKPYIEFIENKKAGTVQVKEFYANGNLRESGTMTAVHHIKDGKWYYYSKNGELDSCINHSEDYTINYKEALQIASIHGIESHPSNIHLTEENNIRKWFVADNEKDTAITIEFYSGKVSGYILHSYN